MFFLASLLVWTNDAVPKAEFRFPTSVIGAIVCYGNFNPFTSFVWNQRLNDDCNHHATMIQALDSQRSTHSAANKQWNFIEKCACQLLSSFFLAALLFQVNQILNRLWPINHTILNLNKCYYREWTIIRWWWWHSGHNSTLWWISFWDKNKNTHRRFLNSTANETSEFNNRIPGLRATIRIHSFLKSKWRKSTRINSLEVEILLLISMLLKLLIVLKRLKLLINSLHSFTVSMNHSNERREKWKLGENWLSLRNFLLARA